MRTLRSTHLHAYRPGRHPNRRIRVSLARPNIRCSRPRTAGAKTAPAPAPIGCPNSSTAHRWLTGQWHCVIAGILLAGTVNGAASPATAPMVTLGYGPLRAKAASEDGRYLATGGMNVRLWSLESGELLHDFEHPGLVQYLAFTPDSRQLVAGSDESVAVSELPTGLTRWRRDLGGDDDSRLMSLAVSGDGTKLALLTLLIDERSSEERIRDVEVRILTMDSGETLSEHSVGSVNPSVLALSEDGNRIALLEPDASTTARVTVLDVPSWVPRWNTEGSRVALLNSRLLYRINSGQTELELWDWNSESLVRTLPLQGEVIGVVSSPDSRWLALSTAQADLPWPVRTTVLVNVQTGEQVAAKEVADLNLPKLPWHLNPATQQVLVVRGYGSPVELWNWRLDHLHLSFGGFQGAGIQDVIVSPDGRLALIGATHGWQGGMANGTGLWEIETGRLVRSWDGRLPSVSRDWSRLLTVNPDGGWELWDLNTGQHIARVAFSHWSSQISPDGTVVASNFYGRNGETDGETSLGLWSGKTGAFIRSIHKTHFDGFVLGGKALIVYDFGNEVPVRAIWYPESDQRVHFPNDAFDAPFWISPDGSGILAALDGHLVIWDIASLRSTRITHADHAVSAVFSENGSELAVGRADGSFEIFAISTGKLMRTLPGTGRLDSSWLRKFGPILLGSTAGTAAVLDPLTGRILREFPGQYFPLALSPDGTMAFTHGFAEAFQVQVWDLRDLTAGPRFLSSPDSRAIEWNHGTLQFAPTLHAPWTDLPVASPFELSPVGAQGFFRVKLTQ